MNLVIKKGLRWFWGVRIAFYGGIAFLYMNNYDYNYSLMLFLWFFLIIGDFILVSTIRTETNEKNAIEDKVVGNGKPKTKISHKTNGEHLSLLHHSIYDVDDFKGDLFEQFLSELFQQLGYKVSVTKGSRDFGADLILKNVNETIVIQAKRYNRNVGIKAIQEVLGSINYYGAKEGWVITNSHFTEQARRLAHASNVRLIDRNELVYLMKKARGN